MGRTSSTTALQNQASPQVKGFCSCACLLGRLACLTQRHDTTHTSPTSLETMAGPLLVAVVVLLVLALPLYFLLFRGPRLQDDWPVQPDCRVKERMGTWPALPPKRLKHITASEFQTLCALCDTILPAFEADDVPKAIRTYLKELVGSDELYDSLTKDMNYYTRGALDADVPARVGDIIEEHLRPDARKIVRMVLYVLETPLGICFLTGGGWYGWRKGGFSHQPFRQREAIIGRLLTSVIEPIRGLTIFIKAMTGRVYFASRDVPPTTADGCPTNPAWVALGYEDRTRAKVKQVMGKESLRTPQLKPMHKEAIPPSCVGGGTDVRELTCDVVIVGSGAGGGTAAAVLTAAGLDVVVLEKGGYYTEKDFAGFGELEGDRALYERAGWFGSEELSVSILAGSCVGGGTTLNWCASFRTPAHVRKEWVEERGLKSFGGKEEGGVFDEALDAVSRRLNVNIEHSHRNDEMGSVPGLVVNQNNERLWQGAKAVGATCLPIPRNVKGCKDCSACERGCPYGAKQSTMRTFLEDAEKTGKLRLVARAHVDKVLRNGEAEAVGVIATVQHDYEKKNGNGDSSSSSSPPSSNYQLIVWATHAVIISAGSLHTPAVLLRSQLKHPKIGRHLALHPVSGVAGLFPSELSDTHKGVGMGTYIPDFMKGGGRDGWGGAIETPPNHAGLAGVIAPWGNAFNYRMWVALKGRFAVSIVISRDESSEGNRVVVDKEGVPRVHYLLTKKDRTNLHHSVGVMMRMVTKQGAKLALPVNEGFRTYRPHRDEKNGGREGEGGREGGLEEYLQYLRGMGMPVGNTALFTAHQMCSCRMASSREEGPVQETGESWETEKLYVMDASVFPTSLGINPMVRFFSLSMYACLLLLFIYSNVIT